MQASSFSLLVPASTRDLQPYSSRQKPGNASKYIGTMLSATIVCGAGAAFAQGVPCYTAMQCAQIGNKPNNNRPCKEQRRKRPRLRWCSISGNRQSGCASARASGSASPRKCGGGRCQAAQANQQEQQSNAAIVTGIGSAILAGAAAGAVIANSQPSTFSRSTSHRVPITGITSLKQKGAAVDDPGRTPPEDR